MLTVSTEMCLRRPATGCLPRICCPSNGVVTLFCLRGNMFTEPLPSNKRLLWLYYSGFRTSCHIIYLVFSLLLPHPVFISFYQTHDTRGNITRYSKRWLIYVHPCKVRKPMRIGHTMYVTTACYVIDISRFCNYYEQDCNIKYDSQYLTAM
jgi:hypothetical protein